MTAADKLRSVREAFPPEEYGDNLVFVAEHGELYAETRDGVVWPLHIVGDTIALLLSAADEIAAVIEAAQVAADYAHHGDLLEWETHCDSVDPGCPGCALLDSLAALNARLDGAA